MTKNRLQEHYLTKVIPQLQKELEKDNIFELPRIVKVTLNMGLGKEKDNTKDLEQSLKELSLIAGQKAVYTYAKKSIANFKIRAKQKIGCKVTLRREAMYCFLDKLISLAVPRIRDFRGFNPTAFDGQGNYALGIKEQIIFPEISYDEITHIRGLNVVITTSAQNNEEAQLLLTLCGFPFATAS